MNKWLLIALLLVTVDAVAGNPPLIPMPQSVQWGTGSFNLKACKNILIQSASLRAEAVRLQQVAKMGIRTSATAKQNTIYLALGEVKAPYNANEAYRLTIDNQGVQLVANTPHGIHNGIQTLLQLINNNEATACTITDYPAYRWRGYMVDVGRNYQSPALLKQQIDRMSRYKLNIFHFHLTEDIAWRLQIKKYPRLTDPEITERNKGKFYSVEEMKDLIRYCKERHITLVPEIDIPGHSKAFTRAMGVDMQSEKGAAIVKEIFKEICTTYDLPYIHIGADEVKITNPHFIPEVSAVIRKYGKQIVAWAPGGNYDDGIIRQLWKEEGDRDVHNQSIQYIDSKFLYISDWDPLNSVVTIFNRQLGGKPHGDSSLLGAEFCLWNDRAVTREDDLISKNAVYPSMLAFSERSWRGNGYPGVVFSIGNDNEQRAVEFKEFEERLLLHKNRYFSNLPFMYVQQTGIRWKLFGPFENKGDLSASFWPEQNGLNLADSTPAQEATGGTIWLWHTHGPAVKAWLPSPKEKTTWYAYTRFWSDNDTTRNMWIATKDLSRSGADATPPKGEWDYMQSKIWINGQIIPPPNWQFPGRPSGRLHEPMVDENFYYRSPNMVRFKKGWNEVLLKLPMSTFDPNLDWQVPPKWMFTVVPL